MAFDIDISDKFGKTALGLMVADPALIAPIVLIALSFYTFYVIQMCQVLVDW